MSLIARFVQRLRWFARLPKLADELGRRRSSHLVPRIADHCWNWPDAELKGYVRAMGSASIRRDVNQLIRHYGLPRSCQTRLTQLALDAMVRHSVEVELAPAVNSRPLRRAA
jgi:hypothetical protein